MQKKIRDKVIRARVDDELKSEVKRAAYAEHKDESDFVREAIVQYLAYKQSDIKNTLSQMKQTVDNISRKLDSDANSLKNKRKKQ